jgi:hypothetical protein
MITQERLKEMLYYHPESGDFVWHIGGKGRPGTGRQAGTLTVNGYIQIVLNRKLYLAHRLAVLYMTGDWPENVDHEDLCRTNNKYSNLRICSWAQNRHNSGMPKTNTSGFKDVFWYASKKKWHVQVRAFNQRHHLGYFEKIEDAVKARDAGIARLHGNFARAA